MRKNNILMAAVLMGAMTFGSCSSDNELTGGDDSVQHLALNFSTRVAGDDTQENFATGDKVKVFADDESTVFTLGSDGKWLNTEDKNYVAVKLPATLTVVSPATETDATKFALPAYGDREELLQNTAEKLAAADFMSSDPQTLTAAPTSAVDFTLKHRLCKVTATISGYGTEFGSTLPTITGVVFFSKGTGVVYSEGAWQVTIGDCRVYPYVTTDKSVQGLHKYEAIVTPGTYAADNKMMIMTVNGESLPVPYTGILEPGKAYNFTLKVGKDYVTLTQVSALPGWGTEGDETEL